MAELKLKTGQVVLVDDEDLPRLIGFNWRMRGAGYRYVAYTTGTKYYQKPHYLHRIVLNAPDGALVDHANHDTLDNRKANLRLCQHTENAANSTIRHNKGKTSKFKGVYWHKGNQKWMARLIRTYLGSFSDEIEAAKAYNAAAKASFKDFALLNPI